MLSEIMTIASLLGTFIAATSPNLKENQLHQMRFFHNNVFEGI